MINKEYWHFKYWKEWSDRIYRRTLNKTNLVGTGRLHHQDKFYNTETEDYLVFEDPEDNYYIKLSKGTKRYLLPKRYIDRMPINVEETIKVKFKKSDTDVWEYIKKPISLKIPSKKITSFRDYIDSFNPVTHSSPKDATFLKLVAFTEGIHLGIEGEVGSMKNANMKLLSILRQDVVPDLTEVTKAQFYKLLYYNRKVNIDEVTSWSKAGIRLIEDTIKFLGDGSVNMNKHALDKNPMLETMDLTSKTITFTYNPVSEHNPNSFDSMWKNADKILDRCPQFVVEGKVLDSMTSPHPNQITQVVDDNFDEMNKIVMNDKYWRDNVYNHLHGYSDDKIKLTRRHLNNVKRLMEVMDVYSNSQQEYDGWMIFLNDRCKAIGDNRPEWEVKNDEVTHENIDFDNMTGEF